MSIKTKVILTLTLIFFISTFGGFVINQVYAATLTDKIIRVATTTWIGNGTKQQNLDSIYSLLADAAKSHPDIIVLSEGVYSIDNSGPFFETVPGPFTDAMAAKAKQYKTYIVANLYEDGQDGHRYNTDVLINKQGQLVGKYRKMRLPPNETQPPYSMTEGTEPKVFDTEFGKLAMEICYDIDIRFPEVTKMEAELGAQLILVPSWGDYTHAAAEFARKNNVFMVTSVRGHSWDDPYPDSAIIANDGTIINGIDNDSSANTCYADIDLTQKTWSVSEPKWSNVKAPPGRTSIPFTNITASDSDFGTNPRSLSDGFIDNINAGPDKGHAYWSSVKKLPSVTFDLGSLKKVGSIGIVQYDAFYQEDYFKLYFSQDGKNYVEYTKGEYYSTRQIRDHDTGRYVSVKSYATAISPGYKYIGLDFPLDMRYIKIVGYGNSTPSYKSTNLTEVTAFEPLDPQAASAPFPTTSYASSPTPAPTEAVTLDNPINLVGKVTNTDTPDTTILTDEIYSLGDENQWTNNVKNSAIIVDFDKGADLKAFSVVGSQSSTQSLFYRLFITTDGITWKEAGVDFKAAYTIMGEECKYYPDYSDPGLAEGNKINPNDLTFKTLQGTNANIVQPVIFKDVQSGVKRVKVVLYGNSTSKWSVWNSVTEINAYGTYPASTRKPAPTPNSKDTVAPNAPSVNSVGDNDKVISGMAERLSIIYVRRDGKLVGSAETKSNGSFTVKIPLQKAGTILSVTAGDTSGNVSKPKIVKVKDKTPPVISFVNVLKSGSKTITGKTEAWALVMIRKGNTILGYGKAKSDGSFSISIKMQSEGTVLYMTAKDKSGNTCKTRKVIVIK